ncbi:ganglioside GM2 activator-like [Ptychodera flava]|uniref:ganglioside GM2 activator-like n=1 Tax=Ptychodera flava TaxID=63121 RepID=UPI00396A0620
MAILRNGMVVAAALTFIACFSFRFVTAHPVDESLQYKLLMDLLSIPQKPHSSNATRLGMTWKNCGSSDPIHANVVITPETIPIPGNIQLSFNATFDITFGAPLQLKLELKKKVVGIFVEIPCVDNIGSCTYDDLCSMIPFPPSQPCPEPLSTYKIPCQCPFPKGMYSLPPSSIEIPTIPDIPSWLTDGDYQATAHLSMSGRELACYEADVSLKAD